ncbi:MAG TPA: hypothetical protein VEW07_00690 [Solirubrobacterales bacterium]|nr:hypothetical protein [Solirubrobacterales bacterium]
MPQSIPTQRDFERMRGLGLTLRMPLFWFQVEPERGRYDFSVPDQVIGEAARRGVRVLPFVYGSPLWLSADSARPPLGDARARGAWTAFLARVVDRYGPAGEFWKDRPARLPIRRWQVWNEPNFVVFWQPRPSPAGYADLLRLSARVIRQRDPDATIVAAGVAPVEGETRPWEFLRRLYRVPGVERQFDVAALHPYAPSVRGVEYEIRQTRRVMARAGDGRTPLQLTELGVASAGRFANPFDRGRRGQARFLERVFARLESERTRWRLAGVDWFTWQDAPAADRYCVFCEFAGLFDKAGEPKPSWWAFRRAVDASVR